VGARKPHGFLGEGAYLRPVGLHRSEQAGIVAQQLRLFLQRVLRGLQPAQHHEVDDAVDLVVGQLAIQRAIVNLRQRADHVVLGMASLAGDEVGEVTSEAVQVFCLLGLLILVELVGVAAPVHVLHDLGAAPVSQPWDIRERQCRGLWPSRSAAAGAQIPG
jgi:hypothetical protein